jgi:hypothetical protein
MGKPNKALAGHATSSRWLRGALLSGMALGLMLGCGGANSKPAAPTITLVTPNDGSYPTVTPIAVTGSGFVSGVSSLNVYIGSVLTGTVILSGDTGFTFLLPAAAVTAPIKVTTDGGTATYATDFVVWPKIQSVVATGTAGDGSPEGAPGSSVTINGWGLMGVNAIDFGTSTIPSSSFTLDTANAITFKVPDGFAAGATSFALQQDNSPTAANLLVVNFTVN